MIQSSIKMVLVVALGFGLLGGAAFADNSASPDKESAARLHRFDDTESIVRASSSVLARNSTGMALSIDTRDLGAGEVHTIWWIIFNDPNACSDPCGEDDLFAPGVNASAVWATGRIADENGQAVFHANLDEGTPPADQLVLFGPGLVDSSTAEIHFIVRTHGPAIDPDEKSGVGGKIGEELAAALNDSALHHVDGACFDPIFGTVGPVVQQAIDDGLLAEAPRICSDVQFGIHRP